MSNYPRHRGFTLIELVIVVGVLVVLAGLVLPSLQGTQDHSASGATKSSMLAIREAIVGGGPGQPGYLSDVGSLPTHMRDLFVMPISVAGASTVRAFDPNTARGWRGPYLRLQDAGATYHIDDPNGFTSVYGDKGDQVAVDGWGRPIILQAPTGLTDKNQRDQFTRLVSAGPDGQIDTLPKVLYPQPSPPLAHPDDEPQRSPDRGDDLLLFLLRADVAP
jgi:prepilin-type N-terminal cleavage/methylation domain-containing protein